MSSQPERREQDSSAVPPAHSGPAMDATAEGARRAHLEELDAGALDELTLLLARNLIYDECSLDWVRARVFADPLYRPRYTLGLRAEGRLVAVAIGVVQARATPEGTQELGHLKVVCTDGPARRQGYATRLLDELEGRFAADGVAAAITHGPLYYFWAGVDVRYSAALCLVQKRGYTRHADYFNVEVSLRDRDFSTAAEEAALAARGITIRRVDEGDRATVDSYMDRWGHGWHTEVMQSFDRTPVSCHIALKEGRIVAFAANNIARPGWFGPMGTDDEVRGLGIGTVLLKRCFVDWQREGRASGEISWVGPLYFYVTAGDARICRVMWAHSKPLAAAPA